MLVGMVALPVSILAILREPSVQNFIVRFASVYLSEKLDSEISIGGLYVDYQLRVNLSDVLIKDQKGNDILRAKQLKARYGEYSKEKSLLRLDQLFLDQADIQLIKYKGDTSMNFSFIIDAFSSDTPKPDTGKPLKIVLNKLKIYDSYFRLADLNKPKNDTGIDYSNLGLSRISLNMDDLVIDGDTISARIQNLSARERSGFYLKKLKGNVHLSPQGLKVDHLKVITDRSELSMNLEFVFAEFKAFEDFVNEVRIETVIGNSTLNLYDVGYFAPSLFELENEFEISGTFIGPVSALRAKNFKFDFGRNTSLQGNLVINGLPNIYETFVNFNITEFSTSLSDIYRFNIPGMNPSNCLPSLM
ncbi:MAG: hypothetical protein U5Q03_05785 [Bacteroidota bacterium]|nr:hypothetical protein [Bacteroidota bacterium]